MRIAILSSFPPEVCGIADYADHQAGRLAAAGHDVDRIAVEDLRRGGWTFGRHGSVRRLADRLAAADEVVVHYQLGLFLDESRRRFALKYLLPHLALVRLFLRVGRRTRMVVHESHYRAAHSRLWLLPQYLLASLVFALPARLAFHTEHERALFRRRFPRRSGLELQEHHSVFGDRRPQARDAARARLGIDPSWRLFLCIGFYTRAKGYEELVQGFADAQAAGLVAPDCRLFVVTSVRLERDTGGRAGLAALRDRWDGRPSIQVLDHYAPGDEFDAWLAACDVLVLPYRSTYSSGVAARARALGCRILARDVGGLAEQLGPGDLAYRSDDELPGALARLAAPPSPTA